MKYNHKNNFLKGRKRDKKKKNESNRKKILKW